MSTKITYNGKTTELADGYIATLPCKDLKMETDVVVEAPESAEASTVEEWDGTGVVIEGLVTEPTEDELAGTWVIKDTWELSTIPQGMVYKNELTGLRGNYPAYHSETNKFEDTEIGDSAVIYIQYTNNVVASLQFDLGLAQWSVYSSNPSKPSYTSYITDSEGDITGGIEDYVSNIDTYYKTITITSPLATVENGDVLLTVLNTIATKQ